MVSLLECPASITFDYLCYSLHSDFVLYLLFRETAIVLKPQQGKLPSAFSRTQVPAMLSELTLTRTPNLATLTKSQASFTTATIAHFHPCHNLPVT
jgi:hypothetical protein